MKHWYQKVNPQSAEYIRTILVLENIPNAEIPSLPLYTKGMPALLFKTTGTTNQVTLFGQSVPDEKWEIEANQTLIAFFFKPFAMATIFKLSALELKDRNIELNLWNAQKAMAVTIQLSHSKSIEGKIEILSHFIQAQIEANQNECKIIRIASDRLMENSNPDALSRLLDELHLSERTFQRIFKKYVGITPNQYRRICQFYLAFSQLKGGHFDTHTDVAYTNGYFDQSHYIRSFKEFTEITPNEYLQSGLTKKK
jgi:AraC-like DNA-binding protein